jgi:hypothetical protein
VPHHQPEDFVRFFEAGELAHICHLAAEYFGIVFAWHHGLRPGTTFEEVPKAIEFRLVEETR